MLRLNLGLVWPVGPPPGLQDERHQQGGGVCDGESGEMREQGRAAEQGRRLKIISNQANNPLSKFTFSNDP